jgi:soluble lytic murein transglycosylase-like protein
MMKEQIQAVAIKWAEQMGLDHNLVLAIISHESSFDPLAVRFEPHWAYLYKLEPFASLNHITVETERQLQCFSYGPGQLMGSVLRELGFKGNLLAIPGNPDLGVYYTCMKILQLTQKYSELDDVIAAYNAGSPRKLAQGYANQVYVDAVKAILNKGVKNA